MDRLPDQPIDPPEPREEIERDPDLDRDDAIERRRLRDEDGPEMEQW